MSFKALVTQNERGRSMVEILGVLAVIGVLSIGGIQGYKYAMDKYRANDIVNEVNLRATDIWHMYQDGEKELPDSPDADAFPEYGEMTQTGFPIMVTSHPPVAFRAWVNDVPSDVCKKVLQENLNDIITGLRFVQVNGNKYADDINICGEGVADNQMVFTSFLNEGGGAVGVPLDPSGKPLETCVDVEDCESCCGIPQCDEKTMSCLDGCSAEGKVCNNSSCSCVECMEDNDCPSSGEICDPATNKCVSVPAKCGEGKQFGKEYRAKNGACVPCSYMSEIVIMNSDENDGVFEVEVAGRQIKDTRSGRAMCQACQSPQHRVEESGSGTSTQTYCATGCIIGNSFLSSEKGCIRCDDSTDEIIIPDDDQAKAQCLACPNRTWILYNDFQKLHYCILRNCPDGYFKTDGKQCTKCNTTTAYNGAVLWHSKIISPTGNLKNEWMNGCNQCKNSTNDTLRTNRSIIESDEKLICLIKCQENQFQDFYGNCHDCTTDETPDLEYNGITSSYLNNLCTSCTTATREVQSNKCVKVNNDECPENQFKGSDYKCYPCTQPGGINVHSDELSGCTRICGEQRFYDSEKNTCFLKCPANHVMSYDGECKACSELGNGYKLGYQSYENQTIQDICRTACGKGVADVYMAQGGTHYCAPTDCGTGKLHGRYEYDKICHDCPTASSKTVRILNFPPSECLACGNHMVLGQYCVYYNPSVSGVCNNDSPDTSKFPDYSAGKGVYYRDNTGVCRPCQDSSNAYEATEEECNSCGGIRIIAGKQCVYGGCTDGLTFITPTGCPLCKTEDIKVKTLNSDEAKHLCEQCGRRVMTIHSSEESYESFCVQQCGANEWQDIDGECHAGFINSLDGKNEIGSDSVSQNKCHNSGRVVEQEGNQYFCMPKE